MNCYQNMCLIVRGGIVIEKISTNRTTSHAARGLIFKLCALNSTIRTALARILGKSFFVVLLRSAPSRLEVGAYDLPGVIHFFPDADDAAIKVYTYDIPLTVTAFEAGLRRL